MNLSGVDRDIFATYVQTPGTCRRVGPGQPQGQSVGQRADQALHVWNDAELRLGDELEIFSVISGPPPVTAAST